MTTKTIKLCDGFELYANGDLKGKFEDLGGVFDYFNMDDEMRSDFVREMFCFGSVSITARTLGELLPIDFKVVAIPCKD